MNGYVSPPKRINLFLRAGIWLAEKITGKILLPARVLAWYPKTAIGAGVLESLVAHKDKNLSRRFLKLVRLQTSFAISCPFCIDMNALDYKKYNISDDEIIALQKGNSSEVDSFSEREKIALEYARSAVQTPISFKESLIKRLKENFTEREIVILASTIAQVDFWGRLIQSLGLPPAGFSETCRVLHLENYSTLKEGE